MPDKDAAFKRNSAYAKKGVYQTTLDPASEAEFLQWVKKNKVPFDPKDQTSDYDMRGFWLALKSGDPKAQSAVDPNDGKLHYPDFWKTPYHETFSNESQWAAPGAPAWDPNDRLVLPNGTVVFDDKAPKIKDPKPSTQPVPPPIQPRPVPPMGAVTKWF